MKLWPWVTSSFHFKRRVFLALIGVFLITGGMAVLIDGPILGQLEDGLRETTIRLFQEKQKNWGGILLIISGIILFGYSFYQSLRAFVKAFLPVLGEDNLKNRMLARHLRRGPRIVAIGGGTGLSVLLRGLKEYTSNITAVVCVTDDGGSSGKIRGEFGILPPGDLRNCLLALADTEPIMEKLLHYRFSHGKGLVGHNLGNLLLTAMVDICGGFEKALKEMGQVLAIQGRVVPSTFENICLAAELEDGSMIMGESLISKVSQPIRRVFTIPKASQVVPEAIEAIMDADAIILGPGSLYTSVIPNLLVPGMVEAIEKAPGVKIYICNVMTQAGETRGFTASDHIKALYTHSKPGIVEYMIVNQQKIPIQYLEKYAQEGASPVEIDKNKLNKFGVKIINAPIVEEGEYIRHHSQKLAQVIMGLLLDKKRPKGLSHWINQCPIADKLGKIRGNIDI